MLSQNRSLFRQNFQKPMPHKPFDGEMFLAPSMAKQAARNSGFTITYNDLPKTACVALVSENFGGTNSGFVTTCVGENKDNLICKSGVLLDES